MIFDKHNSCNDVAQRALMLFMDDTTVKRRVFKVNKRISKISESEVGLRLFHSAVDGIVTPSYTAES